MTPPNGWVVISTTVPVWAKRYIALAAAKLGVDKQDVVTAALKMHRDYLVGTGVIMESELIKVVLDP